MTSPVYPYLSETKRTSEALMAFNRHTPEEQKIIINQSLDRLWEKLNER